MPKRKKQAKCQEDDAGFWAAGPPNLSMKFKDEEGMWLHPDEAKKLSQFCGENATNVKNEIDSPTSGKRKSQQKNNVVPISKKLKTESPASKTDNTNPTFLPPKAYANKTQKANKPIKTEVINIESLRDEFESNAEWSLRSKFLSAHKDSFPIDRLICLSRCFINNEISRCSYPDPVMKLLKSLRLVISDDIVDQKDRLKSKYAVLFVNATEPEQLDIIESEMAPPKKALISFVKAEADYHCIDSAKNEKDNLEKQIHHPSPVPCQEAEDGLQIPESQPQESDKMQGQIAQKEEQFCALSLQLRKLTDTKKDSNCISRLYEAAQRVRLVPHSEAVFGNSGFECKVFVGDVFIAKSTGKNKKAAKTNAHALACTELLKPFRKLVGTHPNKVTFCASGVAFNCDKNLCKNVSKSIDKPQSSKEESTYTFGASNKNDNTISVETDVPELKKIKHHFANLYLRELTPDTFSNSVSCIRQTCEFHKVSIEFNDLNWKNGKVKSMLSINQLMIAEGIGDDSKMAERVAADFALEKLRDVCWTLKFRGQTDCDDEKKSKESLMGGKEVIVNEIKHGKKLSESNIGSKLMKKMGWNGRGIGKNQQGREDPVLVDQVVHRSGLGSTVNDASQKELEALVFKIVNDYYYSYKDTDLAFAPDFTSEERKVIHDACRRFGLKSKSFGSGDERYLVISRLRTPQELFEYVKAKGGETTKYKLLPPRLEFFKNW